MGRIRDLSIVILILALSGMAQAGGGSEMALFPVKEGGKWGYVNREGEVAIEANYDQAGAFRKGLAVVEMGEGFPVRGWGYIDRRGEGRHRTPVRGGGTLCRRPGPGEDGWPMGGYIDHRGEFVWRSTDCNADSYALDFMERKNP